MTLTSRPAYPQVTDYTYDTLDRVTDVRYPAEYGNGTQPRKVVHHDFDVASRLSGVKVDNVSHASSLVYNPASQTTSLKVGTGTNQITESYAYETLTGLLSNQKVQRSATTLLDLSYSYLRAGTTSGRTGQLTKITNNLDSGRDRGYEYDALGRLKKATGGSTATWTQTYSYDKHGNRTGVNATGTADNGTPIPRDGFATLAFSLTTNQITTAGWLYDKAGNQVRAQAPNGGWQRYQYDAANRLVKVKADDNVTVLASYTYADSNERLMVDEGGLRTYYACDGKVEYTESGSDTSPGWSKSYVYLGGRLLSTLTPNGSGSEFVQYHHPDRLGTRLVSNAQDTTSFEQVALPFGIALNAESTGSTNRRFTTYDRSASTGLDYAMNRHYDPLQGRFTQVDPIGMAAASLSDPQSLNMYSYVGNDPVNRTDPSGLFWGKLFGFLKKLVKVIMVALAVALIVVAIINIGNPLVSSALIKGAFALAGLLFGAALGPSWLQRAISVAGAAAGVYIKKPGAIWNIADPGNGRGAGGIGAVLSGIGAIAQFFQQQLPKPKPEPAPEGSSAGKRISPCVQQLLAPWFSELALSSIRLFEGIPRYVRKDAAGYNEGDNFIYLRKIDQQTIRGISLIGHELTHVRQGKRFGQLRFMKYYLQNSWREWRAGRDPGGRGNPLENEAYDIGDAIRKSLQDKFGEKDPCP